MEGECGICYEMLIGGHDEFNKRLDTAAMNGCGHLFHTHCLKATFKKLETVGGQDPYDIPLPNYVTYSNHPECPKCRMKAPACRDRRCLQLHDHYFNGLDLRFGCTPYTTLFLDDDNREQVKAIQTPKPFVVESDKATREIYDLAKTAYGLGMGLEELQNEIEIVEAPPNSKGKGKESEVKYLQTSSKTLKSLKDMTEFLAGVKSRHCEHIAEKYMSKADAHFIWLKQHADQSKTIEAMQDQLDRAHKAAEKNLTEELAGLQRRLEDAKNAETTALNGIIKDLKAKKSQAEKEVKPLQTEITKLRRAAVAMQKKLTKAETLAEGKKESDAELRRLNQEVEKFRKDMSKINKDEIAERCQESSKAKGKRRSGIDKLKKEIPRELVISEQPLDAPGSSAIVEDEPQISETPKTRATVRSTRATRSAVSTAPKDTRGLTPTTRSTVAAAGTIAGKRKRNLSDNGDCLNDYDNAASAASKD